ncbi:MAG: hypothetical protein ACXACD_15725 [Candidatus Thorarchaeota archaeon]|jgi:hypothetical protein
MSSIFPLSAKQQIVWGLLLQGLSHSEIAQQLRTTLQYIHQTRRNAEHKLSRALMEVAEATNLQIKKIRVQEGLLWGYHPGIDRNVVISYTVRDGIKVWHWIQEPESIADPAWIHEMKSYLLNLAQEHGIELSPEQQQLHPATLTDSLFRQLLPEVQP